MIIFGNGSMARVLYDYVRRPNIMFCADDEFVKGDRYCGRPLIKFSSLLENGTTEETLLTLGYHRMNAVRKERLEQLIRCGCKMLSYIDPSVRLRGSACVNETNTIIYDNTVIHAGSIIADNAFISSNVSIGHDCVIGAHSWINSGVALGGGVVMGERCVLGMNCTIAQGVKLGEATFVGANTLVTKDTLPGSVIVSQPGELMGLNSHPGETVYLDSTKFLQLVKLP